MKVMNGRKTFWIMLMAVCMLLVALVGKMDIKAEDMEEGESSETVYTGALGETYEYGITPADSEWSELGTVEEKVEACRISEDLLEAMTDEQLLQAILDFPFIIDVYAYSSIEMGVESIEDICDAYAELLKRDTALDSFMEEASYRMTGLDQVSTEEEINNDILAILVLFQDDFQDELTQDDVEKLSLLSNMVETEVCTNTDIDSDIDGIASTDSVVIKTPNGSVVTYITRTCSHSSSNYHAQLDSEVVDTYGVTLRYSGSCKYNCHSYAWYKQSNTNQYWINNPSIYMTDGSYTKVFTGSLSTSSINVSAGDRVVYGSASSPTHSAVMASATSGAPLATRTVNSKWGSLGVFSHTVSNVPSAYDTSSLTAWTR